MFIFVLLVCAFLSDALASSPEQEEVHFFDVPILPLSQGLIEFASQANITITVKSDLIKGYRTRALIGHLPISRALAMLLSRAPLRFQALDEGNVYLVEKNSVGIVESASASTEEVHSLGLDNVVEELVVTGTQYPHRYQTIINTRQRNGLSIFDSSRFHSVMTTSLLDDLAQSSIVDTLQYTSAITSGEGLLGSSDDFYIRGFRRSSIYIDGLRLSNTTATSLMLDMAEQIEVLKGPSTLLFGQTGAGGVVNVTKKRAENEYHIKSKVLGDHIENLNVSLDVNSMPIFNDTSNLRFIYSNNRPQATSNLNNIFRQSYYSSLQGDIEQTFQYSVNFEHQHLTYEGITDAPLVTRRGLEVVGSFANIIKPYSNQFSANASMLNTSLTYFLSNKWRFTMNHLWQNESRYGIRMGGEILKQTDLLIDRKNTEKRTDIYNIAGQLSVPIITDIRSDGIYKKYGVVRSIYDQEEHEFDISLNVSLDGEVDIFKRTHNISAGLELYHQDIYQLFSIKNQELLNNNWLPESDFNNTYSRFSSQLAELESEPSWMELRELRSLRDDSGAYIQLTSNWNERWSSSMGVRYSKFSGEKMDITKQQIGLVANIDDLSIQLGLTYQPTDSYSIFFNYNESLAINYIVDDFSQFSRKPEVAVQWELGLKSTNFGDRLISTFALFDIKKSNIVDLEFFEGRRVLSGPFTHKALGIDSDITFQLLNNTQIASSFSIIDHKLQSSSGEIYTPEQAADITFSFFFRHVLSTRWSLTAGLYRVSDRSIDRFESVKIDAYQRFDLSASYERSFQHFDLRLKSIVENMGNSEYQNTVLNDVRISRNSGRAFKIQLELLTSP